MMKKNLLTTLFCLFITISLFAYSGGNGTEANPYLISNKADMEQLASNVNNGQTYAGVHFRLTRDLTEASDTITTIVGNSNDHFFSGIFDGNGYEIAVNKTGVFGKIRNATIKNLGVSGRINTYSYYSYGAVYFYYTGGICGTASSNSSIFNCWNNAKIEISLNLTYSYTGGICGTMEGSGNVISNCYNTNLVSGTIFSIYSNATYSYSGGICGGTSNLYSPIINCYNTGDIKAIASAKGSSYAGGISGTHSSIIQNCYVADCKIMNGTDASRVRIGRISGTNGTFTNCYADGISTRINNDPIGSANANSKDGKDETTANLQSKVWLSTNLSWDFESVWCMMNSGEFPELQVQYPGYQGVNLSLELPELTYGSQVTLSAQTNNNAAPISYTSSDNLIAEISGNLLVAKKAGNVTIKATQPSGNGFFAAEYYTNITIQKKELTVTTGSASIIYGETLPASYAITYSGFLAGENESVLTKLPTISTTATANSNAGEYPLTPTGATAENYSFTYVPGVLTIQKRDLQVKPNDATRLYGYANPAFDLSYTGFVNGNTVADIAVKPTLATTATINSNAGEHSITCSGGSAVNYNFVHGTGKLTITKAPLTVSVTNASRNYGANNPTFAVTYSGFRNSDNQNSLTVQPKATCAAVQNSHAGSYPITFTSGEAVNYEFTYVPGTLTINKVPLMITAQSVSMIYGDALPEYSCLYSGFVINEAEESLTKLPTLSSIATSQSNAGTYTVTPSGAESPNYTITYQQGTLTIRKRDLTVKPDNLSRVYGYNNPMLTLSYEGFVNRNTANNISVKPTASTTATVNTNVGEYSITCSGGNATNYNFIYGTGTLTITKAPLTASVNNVSRLYGDDNPTFTISYSGFRNTDSKSSLLSEPQAVSSATQASNVGTYPITVSSGNATNYSFNYVQGTLTVQKAPLTITAENKERFTGEVNPEFTLSFSGFKNNETKSVLDALPTISCLADINSPEGMYDIVLSGGLDNNYSYSLVNGKLKVILSSGINLLSPESVRFYPNPVQRDLFIQADFPIKKVEIYSLSGNLIKAEEHFTEKISMSGVADGVYFVKIYADEGVLIQKVVKR